MHVEAWRLQSPTLLAAGLLVHIVIYYRKLTPQGYCQSIPSTKMHNFQVFSVKLKIFSGAKPPCFHFETPGIATAYERPTRPITRCDVHSNIGSGQCVAPALLYGYSHVYTQTSDVVLLQLHYKPTLLRS